MSAADKRECNRAYALEIGAMVDDRLAERGASLYQLARATGIPYSTLRGKFRKGSRVTLPDLCRVATALDVEPGDLLPVSMR